jgi:hypothetical protein
LKTRGFTAKAQRPQRKTRREIGFFHRFQDLKDFQKDAEIERGLGGLSR